ncbi:hypothetical protein ACIQOW_32560 [Kitasatospora sp. NPDC091335]|uniref:hypothetical protein n=1 Tax=Kitasatospora sp. NPDC091335 TaxID=3364085 RepID=UPI0037F39718
MHMEWLWERAHLTHAQLKARSRDAPDLLNLLLLSLQEYMGNAALNMLKLRKMRPSQKATATRDLQSALAAVAMTALAALLECTEDAPEVFRSEVGPRN